MNAWGIGGVRIGGMNSLFHSHKGRQGFPGGGQVVGGNLETFGGDEEEDMVILAHDLDIGFVACADVMDGSFVRGVKAMAVEGGLGGVVQYGLIGDRDVEHGSEDEGRFSCTEGEGDIERQDKAEDIGSV